MRSGFGGPSPTGTTWGARPASELLFGLEMRRKKMRRGSEVVKEQVVVVVRCLVSNRLHIRRRKTLLVLPRSVRELRNSFNPKHLSSYMHWMLRSLLWLRLMLRLLLLMRRATKHRLHGMDLGGECSVRKEVQVTGRCPDACCLHVVGWPRVARRAYVVLIVLLLDRLA